MENHISTSSDEPGFLWKARWRLSSVSDRQARFLEELGNWQGDLVRREARMEALLELGLDQGTPDPAWLNAMGMAMHQARARSEGLPARVWSALHKAGLDPDFRDMERWSDTPLTAAIRAKDVEALKIILNWKPDLERTHGAGETPLVMAVDLVLMNSQDEIGMEIIRLLLDAGANINGHGYVEKDSKKRRPTQFYTPLGRAVEAGSLEMVNALLELGADPNTKDAQGEAPLHRLALFKDSRTLDMQADIIRALVDEGANVNLKKDNGASPLSIATSNGRASTTLLLLNEGADACVYDNQHVVEADKSNIKHRPGGTPIHHVVISMMFDEKVFEVLRAIEDKNPDCWKWRNDLGETAYDLFERAEHKLGKINTALKAYIQERSLDMTTPAVASVGKRGMRL